MLPSWFANAWLVEKATQIAAFLPSVMGWPASNEGAQECSAVELLLRSHSVNAYTSTRIGIAYPS